MTHLHLVPPAANQEESSDAFETDHETRLASAAIVREISWYGSHPFECIPTAMVDALLRATGGKKPYESNMRVCVRLLDIYLQLTRQRVSLRNGRVPKSILFRFVGALYSERFHFALPQRRFDLVCTVRKLADAVGTLQTEEFPRVSSLGPTAFWERYRTQFETIELDVETTKRARGWPVKTVAGLVWPNLRALHIRYGEEYALDFQQATQRFYSNRNQESVHQVSFLVDYLASLPDEWQVGDFHDCEKVEGLFADYFAHFVETKEKTESYTYIHANWTKGCNFIRKALFESKVIAKPFWDLPKLPPLAGDNETHIREDAHGVRYKAKLLTDVPLKLTQEDAAKLLFRSIRCDVESIKTWAEGLITDLWERHQRFMALAAVGEVRREAMPSERVTVGRTLRSHKNWRENVCATYASRGFETSRGNTRLDLLYGRRVKDVYSLIALPTAGTLLPHMAALVLEHPEITPSFLAELVLYDKHDHVTGVSEVDSVWILEGKKLRKGPDTAQQKIALTDRAAEILAQVVTLTTPLRVYLKAKGDPAWRRVFLETRKGFDEPSDVNPDKRTSGKENVDRLVRQFAKTCGLDEMQAVRLATRFSLTSLRASVVVARYLEKPDLRAAAENLGHERLSFDQIERYVPKALIGWFEERWVRLFQNAVIAEALKDSKYRLLVTDFDSMEDLHEFLNNHALRVQSKSSKRGRPTKRNSDEQVYFSASVETLAVLESIRRSVRKASAMVSALASEWADYADRLFDYIKHAQPPREELVFMLEDAEVQASRYNFDWAIHG